MPDLLPPERRTRLVRILGLLGSDHIGERATAGAMADQLIRQAGLSWDHVVAGTAPAAAKEAPEGSPPWHLMASRILGSGNANPWESNFCEDLISRWRGPVLTERQQQVLDRIYACRVGRA
jgi:hypothetical protein